MIVCLPVNANVETKGALEQRAQVPGAFNPDSIWPCLQSELSDIGGEPLM